MAFVADTAITDDTDFEKILAVQDIQKLNRGAKNWDDLHSEAVNHIIRKLSGNVGDPSDVTNQEVWREYAITWAASRIFRQHALDGGDEISTSKATFFLGELPGLWKEAVAATLFDTDDDGTGDTRVGGSFPQGLNLGSGGNFVPTRGRGVKHGRDMPGFDEVVKDGGEADRHHHGV